MEYWLFSYLSVLLIPLIMISFFAREVFSILETEVSKAYLSSLKQVQYFIDGEFNVIQDAALKLTINDQVNILQGMQWDLRLSDHYTLANIQKNLSILCQTNSFISGVYLYQDYNEIIISDRDIYQKENFAFANEENFGVSSKDFNRMLLQKYSGEFLFLDAVDPDTKEEHTQIVYAISLPLLPTDVVKMNLLIGIDWENLNNQLMEWNWTEGNYISFLTEDGYEIRSPHGEQFYHEITNEHLNETTQSMLLGNTDVILCAIPSNVADGTYFSILPLKQYHEKLNSLMLFAVICILICIFAGGMLSYFYTRHNYQPVQKLLNLLHEHKSKPTGVFRRIRTERQNELQLIQENIEKLLENYNSHTKELDWSLQHLRDHILAQLVDGNFSNTSYLSAEMKRLAITFPSNRFYVVIIRIDNYEHIFFDDPGENDEKNYQLASFIIQNITKELLSANFTAMMAELHSDITILLSTNLDAEAGRIQIQEQMTHAKQFIEENFGICFSYAAGGAYEGYAQVNQCYRDAEKVLEYQELLENSEFIFVEDIPDVAIDGNESPGSLEKLLRCIQAEDFKAAAAFVKDVFGAMYRMRLPRQVIRNKQIGLITLFCEAISSLQQNRELTDEISLTELEQMYQLRTAAEIQDTMITVLSKLEEQQTQAGEASLDTARQQMINYVEENLCDPNLTISMLADHFGFSLSYASKVFKRYTQIGFLNYVHSQRIEIAKQLLVSTDSNLNQIAEQIGYANDIALIRLFKKYTGVTPGKYRELYKNSL